MNDRSRLTITLKKDLLTQVDSIIDGVQIRNRSHAIEYLLSQALGPQVKQAVVLAGGDGVEMRPLTYEVPKPLVPVRGKPVLEYTLEALRDAGVRDVILATGRLGEKVREVIGSGQRLGVRVSYSEENKPLGSAGALKLAESLIHSYPFLVVNGDVLAEINLTELMKFHQERDYAVTLVLTVSPETEGYGMVQMRGDKVVNFIKRGSKDSSQLINAGIYMCNERLFDYIPRGKQFEMEDIFEKLAAEGLLGGYVFEGDWFEVSTPKNYERAIKAWRSNG